MLKYKWCLGLGILVVGAFALLAQGTETITATAISEAEDILGGTITSGGGVTATQGDLVYQGGERWGWVVPYRVGYRDYDDIHLEPGPNGDAIVYGVTVLNHPLVAGAADGTVATALYSDTDGDPTTGGDFVKIPGTDCTFGPLPPGFRYNLQCELPAPVTIPQFVYMALEFDVNSLCWYTCDPAISCPNTGPPGYSEDFWWEEDLIYGGFIDYFFGGCAVGADQSSYAEAYIVAEGAPWACCFPDYSCENILETECIAAGGVPHEGVLCNDMDPPCSEMVACCDVPTGVCTDTFMMFCEGYKQVPFPGELCVDVVARGDCDVPPNVPTLTQWGMIALTVLMLAGLTIKFGRRRTVTA